MKNCSVCSMITEDLDNGMCFQCALNREKDLHLEAVQIANIQRGKADAELRRNDLLEAQVIAREQTIERLYGELRQRNEDCLNLMKTVQYSENKLERALHALECLRDSALSYHDYDCHGDNCATCCDLVESVNRAADIIREFRPTVDKNPNV